MDENLRVWKAAKNMVGVMPALNHHDSLLEADVNNQRLENMDPDECNLHQFAKDGELELMVIVLFRMSPGRQIKKLNKKDRDGFTPLHYAVRYNRVEICQFVIQQGADVHSRGEDGMTPLHLAAKFKQRKYKPEMETSNTKNDTAPSPADGDINDDMDDDEDGGGEEQDQNIEVLVLMLSSGARINEKDFYGLTPLHHAALRGNVECVRKLLEYQDVNIEAMDKQQMTPLHVSALYGHTEIFRILVENGANIQCKDVENGTPLQFAAAEGNLEIVRMVLDRAEKQSGLRQLIEMLDATDDDGNTTLHLCVDNGHLTVVQLIVERCMKHDHASALNARRHNRETPLHLAARQGHLEIVSLLVKSGAAIDKREDGLATPLLLAAQFNRHLVVEFLIRSGANIEVHDADNFTALLIAANSGHVETLAVLLQHKANVTAVDKLDKTVIFQCAEENRAKTLQFLLKYRKVRKLLEVTDRYDNTPLHAAASEGHYRIAKMLIERGATVDLKNEDEQTPLHLAADRGHVGIVRLLADHKFDILQDDDENANTALHLAALAGHVKCVEALVGLGASIDARNAKQWTPLDCCAYGGMCESAVVLLEADCAVDPKDKRKITPLHLACKQGHADMVELLLRWKADACLLATSGRNALDLAIDHGHPDCARAIIDSEQWRCALKNRTKNWTTGRFTRTPMRKLIRKMPAVAEEVFKKCIADNGKNPDDPAYKLSFDYEFLDDDFSCTHWYEMDDSTSESSFNMSAGGADEVYDEDGYLSQLAEPYVADKNILLENHPLLIMVKSKQTDLLRHPIILNLLNYKWRAYGRVFYYTNLLAYVMFLVALNVYMLTVPPPYVVNTTATSQQGCVIVVTEAQHFWGPVCPRYLEGAQSVLKIIILILAGVGLTKELLQMISHKLSYFKSVTNVIELVLYVLAVLVVLDFSAYGLRLYWQWECGAAALFLSWIGLLLFIENIPRFGLYVLMFTDVFRTFLSFCIVFLLFVIGFAFSFHVLLRNQTAFDKFWNALIKTFVMMIGEFDFDSIFNAEATDTDYSAQVQYDAITYVLFVVFVIIMSIIIMNLLVGLAVDDIKEVQENALRVSLTMQVKLALDVEYTIPQSIRRRFMRKNLSFWPNRYRKRSALVRWFYSVEHLNDQAIAEALNPEKSELESMEARITSIDERLKHLGASVKQLHGHARSIGDVTRAIAEHLKIESSPDAPAAKV